MTKAKTRTKHFAGVVRGSAYVAVFAGFTLFMGARNARAEVEDRTMELGRRMFALANATHHDVTDMEVNGQHVFVGTSVTRDDARAVLDRYEHHCRVDASHSPEGWRSLTPDAAKSGELPLASGAMRSGTDTEGTLLCFTKSARTMASLEGAIASFAETGELARIGNVRLVYVKRAANGEGTHVLTVWTDERMNLLELVPKDGSVDARGSDFPNVPRIDGAARVFSARAVDTAYGLNVYRGTDAPAAVANRYDAAMQGAGWARIDGPPSDATSRLYFKDGVVLTFASTREGTGTFTALALAGVATASR